ncbi:MAG: hypothetical protein J3Q66DRAFT_393923 [Benniella sp.]|nr:MAG: hypothetical protein J3Q66DRAFT_393923 [Benniella sp.]
MPPETGVVGRRYQCTPNTDGSCNLHPHSVTSAMAAPPVFSSKAAPGVIMGVGNVGSFLLPWKECDTYLSEDGGLTWKAVLEHPHNADRGKTWRKYDFDESIRPGALISDPESTSQKSLLFVRFGTKFVGYQVDLSNVYDRKCELDENNVNRSDFEKRYICPQLAEQSRLSHGRQDMDFECDFNYVLKDGKCELEGKEVVRDGECKKEGDTYLGSSGYRKVPGNACGSDKGIKKDEPVRKTCTVETVPVPTDITHTLTKFDSPMMGGFQYFLKSSVVMLWTGSKQVWRSADDGSTWKSIVPDAGAIYVLLSTTRMRSKSTCLRPRRYWSRTTTGKPLKVKDNECFTTLYRTQDAGESWKEVDTWVDKAVYASHRRLDMPDHGIFSMAWKKPMPQKTCQDDITSTEAHPLQMVYMVDSDQKKRLVFFDHVVQFYVVEQFLAVTVEVGNSFVLHVSLNGHDFSPAVFPPNIRVDKNGFTVLQSTTGALVLDVAKSTVAGREYGRLFKSNSEGTQFSLQLDNTNRNIKQLVDWGKIGGIEGVILANQVINIDSLARDGAKHVRTLVSFNDGGSWAPIRAPTDSNCRSDECSLHLHSVTDYNGPGAVFSAPSSVGLVMGVGNVGKYLLPLENSQTYLSRDAGRTWKQVSNKRQLYEFGDEGGVLVLADPSAPTGEILYSYDFGSTWKSAKFADDPVNIQSVTTEPTSDTSKITVTGSYARGDQQFIVSTLDFANRRDCLLDKNNAEKSDFEKWSSFEGENDRCILGKEVKLLASYG